MQESTRKTETAVQVSDNSLKDMRAPVILFMKLSEGNVLNVFVK